MENWLDKLQKSASAEYLVFLLLLLVFVTDSLTQLGFAHGVLYAPVLIFASLLRDRRLMDLTALLSLTLIWLGMLMSPEAPSDFNYIYVLANRGGASLCLVLIYLQIRASANLLQIQKQQHAEIYEQQKALSLLSQMSKYGLWRLDLHSNSIELSDNAIGLLNVANSKTLTISNFCNLFKADYQPMLLNVMNSCANERKAFDVECPYLTSNNQSRWVRIISLVHETDTSTSIEGLILDINEVHQTNSRLMQMQQRFEMWANTMPISVWTAAYNGEPTFVNKHLCEFTGGSQEELISEYQRFIHPDDREMVTQAWLHSIRTKEPFSLNYRMMSKGGDFVMHMTKAVAHYSDEGLIERWLGFAIPTPSK